MRKAATAVLVIASTLGATVALARAYQATPPDLPPVIVDDRPIAGPYSRAAGWPAFVDPFGSPPASGISYFYAPGTGPRCDFNTIRRVQGRLVRACD